MTHFFGGLLRPFCGRLSIRHLNVSENGAYRGAVVVKPVSQGSSDKV